MLTFLESLRATMSLFLRTSVLFRKVIQSNCSRYYFNPDVLSGNKFYVMFQ